MMNRKKQPCRYFQNGRCRFGDQCKFLHVNPNQRHIEPSGNQWNPFAATSSTATSIQPEVADHECTNPESCKQKIDQDLNHELPVWKLTCYGHSEYRPCDIVGDISYEELRAAAYDDAQRRILFLSIVERERNLLNSKLLELGNLLRQPYVLPNTATTGPSSFPAISLLRSTDFQNNVSTTVSSFTQRVASLDMAQDMINSHGLRTTNLRKMEDLTMVT